MTIQTWAKLSWRTLKMYPSNHPRASLGRLTKKTSQKGCSKAWLLNRTTNISKWWIRNLLKIKTNPSKLRICFKIQNPSRPTRKTWEAQVTTSINTHQKSTMDSNFTPPKRALRPMTRIKYQYARKTNLPETWRLWIFSQTDWTEEARANLTKASSKNSISLKSRALSNTHTCKK